MMMTSYPAFFISAGKCPPVVATPIAPVAGDFALMAMRLAHGMVVPVNGPGAKISLFSGPSGSQSAGTSS